MSMGSAMKSMGRTARFKAEAVTHDMKDRALEKRLDRAETESERLKFENDLLRDEVAETRSEHKRILDLLEARLTDPMEGDVEGEGKRSHKGRWFLFLAALGGGVYYWFKQRRDGMQDEWGDDLGVPAVTETGTATTL